MKPFHDEEAGVAQGAPNHPGGADAGSQQPAAPKKESVRQWSTKKLLYTLRFFNLLNGVIIVLTGFLVFLTGLVNVTFTTVTVSAYVVFFGLVMACLECNISNIAPKFRRNFGFMFSFYGRTLFILFCATMLFALNTWLGWLVGALTAVNGLFNGYVICVHPSFKTELNAKGDPYGGYSGGETVMINYLKSNPQLAAKASTAAAQLAVAHPNEALQIASAVGSAKTQQGGGNSEANPFG